MGPSGGAKGPLAPGTYARDLLPYVRGLEAVAQVEGEVVCNLDSTDMAPAVWEDLASRIAANLDDYDGFVVLHGTDTMAYTACALSLLLDGLSKPVVLTGSQRPLAEVRTDARINVVHSAICATMPIPEVCLYFDTSLFRGNRATKVSIQDYDAFASPNFPPLVVMGVDVHDVTPPLPAGERLVVRPGFSNGVVSLSLVPGTPPVMLDAAVQAGVKAVVLRAFGEGNVPLDAWPAAIRRATDAGVLVVVLSQCLSGVVRAGRYQGSVAARDAGATFGLDMTAEMAVVKAMWLLAQGHELDELRRRFPVPIAGECSLLGV